MESLFGTAGPKVCCLRKSCHTALRKLHRHAASMAGLFHRKSQLLPRKDVSGDLSGVRAASERNNTNHITSSSGYGAPADEEKITAKDDRIRRTCNSPFHI